MVKSTRGHSVGRGWPREAEWPEGGRGRGACCSELWRGWGRRPHGHCLPQSLSRGWLCVRRERPPSPASASRRAEGGEPGWSCLSIGQGAIKMPGMLIASACGARRLGLIVPPPPAPLAPQPRRRAELSGAEGSGFLIRRQPPPSRVRSWGRIARPVRPQIMGNRCSPRGPCGGGGLPQPVLSVSAPL